MTNEVIDLRIVDLIWLSLLIGLIMISYWILIIDISQCSLG